PGVGHAGDRRRVTDARLIVGVVGAPEGGEFAQQVGLLIAVLGGAEPVDRIRSRLGADVEQFVADLGDRLVPGDAGPFAVDQLGRIFEPAVAMRMLAHRGALGAMGAQVEWAVEAGLLAGPYAVLHRGDDGAADRAMGA